ncbi:MAG: hypothetical protein Q4G43_10395 [Mobilicoccus sp.]|nr:hypothetical protein [Mobilicoccus sp.]
MSLRHLLAALAAISLVMTTSGAATARGGDIDVPNSGRGQYLWHPGEYPSGVGTSAVDSYVRYTWRHVEPQPGRYDFSSIDAELAAADRRGGTFSFRVMPVCAWCGADAALPPDLDAHPGTWTASLTDGGTVRVPDWNSEEYLTRWEALMAALGERYEGDPRLGHVDTGGYGNWGEGHNWPYMTQYRGAGREPATVATVTRISRAVVTAFPSTFIAHNPVEVDDLDGRRDPAATWAALKTTLASSRTVGLRNDCLGGGSVQRSALDLLADAQARAEADGTPLLDRPLDRWRVAPVITEWCDNIAPGSTDGSFAQGAEQVRALHVSQVSNANFVGRLDQYSAAEQRAFHDATAASGFRLGARATVRAQGRAVTAMTTWRNDGVAPLYRDVDLTYTLRDTTGRVRGSATGTVDLRTLLGDGASTTETVRFAGVPRGRYTVHVSVNERAGERPVQLASGSRGRDGSYTLGAITLR